MALLLAARYRRFWHIAPATGKWCQRCHEYKALDAFHANPTGRHMRHSWCRACRAAVNRKEAA